MPWVTIAGHHVFINGKGQQDPPSGQLVKNVTAAATKAGARVEELRPMSGPHTTTTLKISGGRAALTLGTHLESVGFKKGPTRTAPSHGPETEYRHESISTHAIHYNAIEGLIHIRPTNKY